MGNPGSPSWESVLAAVEHDVLRTEELLSLAAADPDDPTAARIVALATQLRAVGLPTAERMPPVPAGLRGRVQALGERIAHARAGLEAAMTSTRRQLAATPVAAAVPVRSPSARAASFIDTTA